VVVVGKVPDGVAAHFPDTQLPDAQSLPTLQVSPVLPPPTPLVPPGEPFAPPDEPVSSDDPQA
jgi:hypothetical protein